jgi:hypothetical protein
MSVADNMGAYMAGRFAGKMSASVEAEGALAEQQRIAKRSLRLAVDEMNSLEGALYTAAAYYAFESTKNAGFAAVRDQLDEEAGKLAEVFASGGAVTGAEFQKIAPFTAERKLTDSERTLSLQAARAAAFEALKKFDFGEFGAKIGSNRAAEMRARISEWLEDFYR